MLARCKDLSQEYIKLYSTHKNQLDCNRLLNQIHDTSQYLNPTEKEDFKKSLDEMAALAHQTINFKEQWKADCIEHIKMKVGLGAVAAPLLDFCVNGGSTTLVRVLMTGGAGALIGAQAGLVSQCEDALEQAKKDPGIDAEKIKSAEHYRSNGSLFFTSIAAVYSAVTRTDASLSVHALSNLGAFFSGKIWGANVGKGKEIAWEMTEKKAHERVQEPFRRIKDNINDHQVLFDGADEYKTPQTLRRRKSS